jgi:hypothetical protein
MDLLVIAVADALFMEFLLQAPWSTNHGVFLCLKIIFQNCCTIVAQVCYTASTVKEIFMHTNQPKSAFMTVRVTDKTRTKFHDKAQKIGKPSEVHREIVEAFVEDRLTIQPPVIRKLEKLYVTRTQD